MADVRSSVAGGSPESASPSIATADAQEGGSGRWALGQRSWGTCRPLQTSWALRRGWQDLPKGTETALDAVAGLEGSAARGTGHPDDATTRRPAALGLALAYSPGERWPRSTNDATCLVTVTEDGPAVGASSTGAADRNARAVGAGLPEVIGCPPLVVQGGKAVPYLLPNQKLLSQAAPPGMTARVPRN